MLNEGTGLLSFTVNKRLLTYRLIDEQFPDLASEVTESVVEDRHAPGLAEEPEPREGLEHLLFTLVLWSKNHVSVYCTHE